MKLLVIPDVHGRTFWKDAVEKYTNECDKIIFIGDYVDPYKDEGITRKESMAVFDEIINFRLNNPDKVVLLIGNHDAHYMIPHFVRSTRYDSSNAYHLKEMYRSHGSIFKLAHEETVGDKKVLFTHAGLMNSWVERNKNIIGDVTVDNLNHLIDIPGGVTALSDISKYRTWLGYDSGSIIWSDIREKIDIDVVNEKLITLDDSIVKGYDYQIFGHTLMEKEMINDNWACLDCKKAFILNDDMKLEEI